MNDRTTIAVSRLSRLNILSDETIRNAFKEADKILEISEEADRSSGQGMFGKEFDNALANLGSIRKRE